MRKRILKAGIICLTCIFWFGSTGQVAFSKADDYRVAQTGANGLSDAINARGMSDKEKLRYANDSLDEMRAGVKSIQERIEDARKAKSIEYLSCLNEKVSNLGTLLTVTETAAASLNKAVGENNSQMIEHEFQKVSIARVKARKLLVEANECINQTGDNPDSTGEVEASVIVDNPIEYDPVMPDPNSDPIEIGVVIGNVVPPVCP